MTNQEAKQEAIKKAYGKLFNSKKHLIDENGWLDNTDEKIKFHHTDFLGDCEFKNNCFFRPKTLSEIENNNGWIRIEPDGSNLPNKGQSFDMYMTNGSIKRVNNIRAVRNWFTPGSKEESCTHYKPITPEIKPIY